MGQKHSSALDVRNLHSITEFSTKILKLDENTINESSLITNIKNVINALKNTNEKKYESLKTKALLLLIQNMAFLCKSQNVIEAIIKEGLHSVFAKIIDNYLKEKKIRSNNLTRIFGALASTTFFSSSVAEENVKFGIHKKAMDLLKSFTLAEAVHSKDDASLGLYNALINFLQKNSSHVETRKDLVDIGVTSHLLEEAKKIDGLLKDRKELKYVKADVITTVANLLNDKDLDTLSITGEIAATLAVILKEIIEKSTTNDRILENTKYYTTYTIDNVTTYINAYRHLCKIIAIAVNDTIKQKLYDEGIISMLKELIQNGNEVEIEKSTELLCSLCFNQAVSRQVKDDQNLMKLIKDIEGKTMSEPTKRSCKQIYDMVSTSQAPKSQIVYDNDQHIMISYNHKYKEICLRICDLLVSKGHKVWIDVRSSFNDLHEAMAEAVEKAIVVIVCYSYDYKISNNCRMEFQYAIKLKKPIIAVKLENYDPDGWLGLYIASNLYIDFSKTNDFEKPFLSLLKQIDSVLTKRNKDPLKQTASTITAHSETSEIEN